MHHTFLPNTPLTRNTIQADHRTCLQLSNLMELYSKWPQEEPIMSQHWLFTDWLYPVHMSSRRSNQIWVKHSKHHHQFQQTRCTPLLCKLNYLLTRRLNVYRDHNTSPLREVQLFTSTWSPNQLLENPNTLYSFIWVVYQMAAPLWLPTYLTQGIKPIVVHWNELHRA